MSHLEYIILVLVGGIIGSIIRWREKSKEIKHSDRTFHPEWKDNKEKDHLQ